MGGLCVNVFLYFTFQRILHALTFKKKTTFELLNLLTRIDPPPPITDMLVKKLYVFHTLGGGVSLCILRRFRIFTSSKPCRLYAHCSASFNAFARSCEGFYRSYILITGFKDKEGVDAIFFQQLYIHSYKS